MFGFLAVCCDVQNLLCVLTAVDIPDKRIYFYDEKHRTIESVSFNGTHFGALVTAGGSTLISFILEKFAKSGARRTLIAS